MGRKYFERKCKICNCIINIRDNKFFETSANTFRRTSFCYGCLMSELKKVYSSQKQIQEYLKNHVVLYNPGEHPDIFKRKEHYNNTYKKYKQEILRKQRESYHKNKLP